MSSQRLFEMYEHGAPDDDVFASSAMMEDGGVDELHSPMAETGAIAKSRLAAARMIRGRTPHGSQVSQAGQRGRIPIILARNCRVITSPFITMASVPAEEVMFSMVRAEQSAPVAPVLFAATSVGAALPVNLKSALVSGQRVEYQVLKIVIAAGLTTFVPALVFQLTGTTLVTPQGNAVVQGGAFQIQMSTKLRAAELFLTTYSIINSRASVVPYAVAEDFTFPGTVATTDQDSIYTFTGLPTGYVARLQTVTRGSIEGIAYLKLASAARAA